MSEQSTASSSSSRRRRATSDEAGGEDLLGADHPFVQAAEAGFYGTHLDDTDYTVAAGGGPTPEASE